MRFSFSIPFVPRTNATARCADAKRRVLRRAEKRADYILTA
jgi:hypothetical protein